MAGQRGYVVPTDTGKGSFHQIVIPLPDCDPKEVFHVRGKKQELQCIILRTAVAVQFSLSLLLGHVDELEAYTNQAWFIKTENGIWAAKDRIMLFRDMVNLALETPDYRILQDWLVDNYLATRERDGSLRLIQIFWDLLPKHGEDGMLIAAARSVEHWVAGFEYRPRDREESIKQWDVATLLGIWAWVRWDIGHITWQRSAKPGLGSSIKFRKTPIVNYQTKTYNYSDKDLVEGSGQDFLAHIRRTHEEYWKKVLKVLRKHNLERVISDKQVEKQAKTAFKNFVRQLDRIEAEEKEANKKSDPQPAPESEDYERKPEADAGSTQGIVRRLSLPRRSRSQSLRDWHR